MPILIALLVLAIVGLLVRNRSLVRGQRIWMNVANRRRPTQSPLPQAAETISLAQFDRATDRLHERLRLAEDALHEASWQLMVTCDERDYWMRYSQVQEMCVDRLRDELADETSKHLRLADLYRQADLDRQRLRLENERFAKERATSVN